MSDSESADVTREAAGAPLQAEVPAPAPEPWTPQRALEWNRYYDWYLLAALLVLVLVSAMHPISRSSLWNDLQTGRLIAERGPVMTDPYSYTMEGKRWVNVPWAFQLVSAKLHDAMNGLGLGRPGAWATGSLVVMAAVLRMLTALVLLQVRRPGPGLWWVVVCVAVALGVAPRPMPGASLPYWPTLGGIASWAEVDSANWGLLLFALQILLLFRATSRGCRKTLLILLPLFALWANVDESFLYGLIILALWSVGVAIEGGKAEAIACGPVGRTWALGILAGCAAAALLNPNFLGAYGLAARPFAELFGPAGEVLTGNQLSFFGPESRRYYDRLYGGEGSGGSAIHIVYYAVCVALGLASFALNRRRFSLSRFLMFAGAAVIWGALAVTAPGFAVVLAGVVGLNGQEWYQGQFGVAGRVGLGWGLWSVGGRAVTLLLLFLMTVKGLTGFAGTPGEPPFGLEASEEDFAFEVADFLADAPVKGNVLNLTLATGDALIWRAWPLNPARKTFIDGRDRFFPPSLRRELQTARQGFVEGKPELWRPVLDKYGISMVLVPTATDPGAARVYAGLTASPDFLPFYDDGSVVLFGRADAAAEDLAFFQGSRLEPTRLAFRTARTIPSSDQYPAEPSGWFDRVFRNRFNRPMQPHVYAADRWLTEAQTSAASAGPPPARCLLAIGEARTALSRNANDAAAWRMLAEGYRQLSIREGEILGRGSSEAPPAPYLSLRFQQQAAALNYAIQSTPPPTNESERLSLGLLNLELAQLFMSFGVIDLARDHLEQARRLMGAEFTEDLEVQLGQLDEAVTAVVDQLEQMTLDPQGNPVQRGELAQQQGTPGLAIQQLEEAESYGINRDAVKSRLLDLYCQVGRPDKALELFSGGNVEDPALYTGPGSSAYRQGLVNLLIGSYDLAASLWRDRSLPQIRSSIAIDTLESLRMVARGLPREASDGLLQMPGLLDTQAAWLYQLGLMQLEAGAPDQAAAFFRAALEVSPKLTLKPLLDYYLEQIGEPAAAAAGTEAPAPGPEAPTVVPAGELPVQPFSSGP